MTVLGPIAPEQAGVSLIHEHVLIDMECYWQRPATATQERLAQSEVHVTNLGALRRNPALIRDNLLLTDLDLAIRELLEYRNLGGATIVDVTPPDLGRDPTALQAVARTTGLNVVAGCGHYISLAHPPGISWEPVEAIAERIHREIIDGIDGTGVRPGIIGEIGTSDPLKRDEEKVLRAAASAQQQTGLAITVHLDAAAGNGLEMLDILESAGADPTRVVMGHLDATIDEDLATHWELARRGCFIAYDCCGQEMYFPGLAGGRSFWLPLDKTRASAVVAGFEAGVGDHLLVSQDVCKKMDLTRYGGFGYGHILRSFVPSLREAGLESASIDQLLVANPRRVLTC